MKKEYAQIKSRYKDIVQNAVDGIFLKDISGKYQLINNAAAKPVGVKIKDFIGKTDFGVFPRDVAKEIVEMDKKILRTKRTVKFEEKLVLKGKEVYFETIKYPILDRNRKPVFLCGIVRDITKLRQNERDLAERVKELTALYKISKDIEELQDLNSLFKDVAELCCSAMGYSDPFFIIWLIDGKKKKRVESFWGLADIKTARKVLLKNKSFSVPLKMSGKKVGGFIAGYKEKIEEVSKEEKEFIKEIAEIIGKEIERRKIKEDLDRMFIEVVKSFSSALDARDHYTVDHSKRISNSCRLIAEELNINDKKKEDIILGALLHDIGKIGISDGILGKPAALTPEEFDSVKQHPLISENILKPIEALKGTLKIIRHHHERYDGKGYPDGLRAKRIPVGARILAVCDAYDAMISERPYRRAMDVEKAIAEIGAHSGTQFDPVIAGIMINLVKKNIFR